MSLKRAAKERLLWAIKQVVVPFGRVIMLVDPKSLKVVSSCCSVSDLLDEGVDLVEMLTKKREPLRGKNVLCILSDDYSYLDLILADFVPGRERYQGVFFMFNCHMRDTAVLKRIAEAMDFDKVLGCFELHLNFVAFESNVFFTQNFALRRLYTNDATSPDFSSEYVDRVVSRLASVCSVLNVHPRVGYYSNDYPLSARVASELENLLENTLDKGASKNCDLLVFDRSVDLSALFMHEYTYQAFVYDMVNVGYCSYQNDSASNRFNTTEPGRASAYAGTSGVEYSAVRDDRMDNCFKFKYTTNTNKEEDRVALLDSELDVLWRDYRHLHIQHVNNKVSDQINKFADEKAGPKGSKEGGMVNTLKMLRNIPNLQYIFDKLWAHMRLTEACFQLVEQRKLIKIGTLEQMLATNVDANGKHTTHAKCMDRLVPLLGEDIDEGDKVRLILLYLINFERLTKSHLTRLSSQVRLSNAASEVIQELLTYLPVAPFNTFFNSLNKDRDKKDKKDDDKIAHRLEKSDLYNYYKKVNTEYDLSRYVSGLVYILTHYVNSGYTHPMIASSRVDQSRNTDKRAHNDDFTTFNFVFSGEQKEDRKKLIVYVLGGITFSECREVYKLAAKKKVDMYLGGDEILIPGRLVQ